LYQRFSKPDLYCARCGHLDAVVTTHRIGGAPPYMRGLRAVFVADAHVRVRTTQADLDGLADRIASAQPQLLLLGGDYADKAEDCVRFFKCLEKLTVPLGGYGVVGNNDAEAWSGNMRELRRVMARARCRLLINQSVQIPCNGGVIRVGGIDEYRYGHPLDTRGTGGHKGANDYRILLSHYPVLPKQGADLMLCGHTHGGQFNLLGLTPYAIGFERFNRPRRASVAVAGLHDIDGMKLLVSKGIGASRIQLRVGVRPEINLLVFE
jgi:predicted MPP superfamily phosphohydrolase